MPPKKPSVGGGRKKPVPQSEFPGIEELQQTIENSSLAKLTHEDIQRLGAEHALPDEEDLPMAEANPLTVQKAAPELDLPDEEVDPMEVMTELNQTVQQKLAIPSRKRSFPPPGIYTADEKKALKEFRDSYGDISEEFEQGYITGFRSRGDHNNRKLSDVVASITKAVGELNTSVRNVKTVSANMAKEFKDTQTPYYTPASKGIDIPGTSKKPPTAPSKQKSSLDQTYATQYRNLELFFGELQMDYAEILANGVEHEHVYRKLAGTLKLVASSSFDIKKFGGKDGFKKKVLDKIAEK